MIAESSIEAAIAEARDEAAGVGHVVLVSRSEGVEHEAFFARRAEQVHDGEGDERVPAGEPVFEKEALGEAEEKDGGVHGVADVAIDAVCD